MRAEEREMRTDEGAEPGDGAAYPDGALSWAVAEGRGYRDLDVRERAVGWVEAVYGASAGFPADERR